MDMKAFKIGDEVIIRDYGSRTSEDNARNITAIVTKIGKKYVTVQTSWGSEYQFHNERNRTYYLAMKSFVSSENKLFHSEQDYLDWVESEELYKELRNYFGRFYTDLTIDQLRRIKAITEEK